MPEGRDPALVCSVVSGRKGQAKQRLLPESEKRSTAFENSVAEEQRVVGMTQSERCLSEMGLCPETSVGVSEPTGTSRRVSLSQFKKSSPNGILHPLNFFPSLLVFFFLLFSFVTFVLVVA